MKTALKIHTEEFSLNQSNPVVEAVDGLVNFVKPTLGPKVKHVLVDNGFRVQAVDDGVTIANEYDVPDPFQSAVIRIVREIPKKADDKVGDGTTTSLVLAQALLKAIYSSGKGYREVLAELHKGKEEFKEILKSKTKPINSADDLYLVANTSLLDEKAARVVADTIFNAGSTSAITVEEHGIPEVTSMRVEGFEFDRGYASPYFVTNMEHGTATVDEPVVVLTDKILSLQEETAYILQKLARAGKKNVVFIANDIQGQALAVLIKAHMERQMNILAIRFPTIGEFRKEFFQDLAVVTGATVISDDNGLNMEDADMKYFGSADKIVSDKDDTKVIGGKGDLKKIADHIKHLKVRIEKMLDEGDKELIYQRVARLLGGVAVIKVGGHTEAEMHEKKFKVVDAVNSCKAAMESGIVPGGGVSFLVETSSPILNSVFPVVMNQICENAEINIPTLPFNDGDTYDAVTAKVGNFLEIGVVDAAKVLETSLESAISIAQLITNTSGIITDDNSERARDNRKL